MRRFFHGKHCNIFGSRFFKSSSFWVWLALVVSPLAALADSLMDAQDIYEQWSQYVDPEVAAHLFTAKELYEYCGSDADFGDVRTGGVGLKVDGLQRMSWQSRAVILPRWVLVLSEPLSEILTDYTVYSYESLPDYLAFFDLPSCASNRPTFYSQIVAYGLSDSGVSNYFARHYGPSWTNSLFRLAGNFLQGVQSVISVPYGPYWHQDSSVGWCTSETYHEITGRQLDFPSDVWMMLDFGHSSPLVHRSSVVLNYGSSDSAGYSPLFFPDGASYRDSIGVVRSNSYGLWLANPLEEKYVLEEVFPNRFQSYTNLFKPRSMPW